MKAARHRAGAGWDPRMGASQSDEGFGPPGQCHPCGDGMAQRPAAGPSSQRISGRAVDRTVDQIADRAVAGLRSHGATPGANGSTAGSARPAAGGARPDVPKLELAGSPAQDARLQTADNAAVNTADGPVPFEEAAAPDLGSGEGNELGRQNIGSDGRLNSLARTYAVEAVEDAEGCDFLVAAGVMNSDHCRAIADAFHHIEARIALVGGSSGTRTFCGIDEILDACPVAGAPIIAARRRAPR